MDFMNELIGHVIGEGIKKGVEFVGGIIKNYQRQKEYEENRKREQIEKEKNRQRLIKANTLVCENCGNHSSSVENCYLCGSQNIITLELYEIPKEKRDSYLWDLRHKVFSFYLGTDFLYLQYSFSFSSLEKS